MNSLTSPVYETNAPSRVNSPPNITNNPVNREPLDIHLGGTEGVRKNTQQQLEWVLAIRPVTMDQLTIDRIKSASDVPLLIEVGDQYASIVPTSQLEDGTEVYTIRYGITEVTKFPKFSGISLLYRHPDGNISYQGVLTSDPAIDAFNSSAKKIATQLSNEQEISPSLIHDLSLLTEVIWSRNKTGNIYELWKNKLGQDMYLTVFYNGWSDQVWLQMELTKFKDKEGNNSVYIGSMVNGGSIKLRVVVLKYLIENKDKYGVTDDWKVHFFRDDTHTDTSAVRKVWDYYNLAGIPRS